MCQVEAGKLGNLNEKYPFTGQVLEVHEKGGAPGAARCWPTQARLELDRRRIPLWKRQTLPCDRGSESGAETFGKDSGLSYFLKEIPHDPEFLEAVFDQLIAAHILEFGQGAGERAM